jgi:hypothetical protein
MIIQNNTIDNEGFTNRTQIFQSEDLNGRKSKIKKADNQFLYL